MMRRFAKPKNAHILAVLVLLVLLVVGLCTYRDYSFTYDEWWERESSIINYQYLLKKLIGHDLRLLDVNLSDYESRYYGVALQLPMVVVEHLNHFSMSLHDVFIIRHLFTFLICWAGWACLYIFFQKVFQNRWLSLLGLLMISLYPRFYGEQFTNVKDMVFTATCCASLMMVALCLEKRRWWVEILAAMVFALCVNTRVIGLMIPLLLMGYRILAAVLRKKEIARECLLSIGQLVLTFVFYLIVTPAAWEEPFTFLPNAFATFSRFETWDSTIPFLGQMVRGKALPWYYIPVWLLVSVPIWYLCLLAVGLVTESISLASMLHRKQGIAWYYSEHRYGMLCFVMAAAPVALMLVKPVTMYNSWRHVYYIFPFLVTLMLFGARWLWRRLSQKNVARRGLCAVMAVLLIYQTGWIVRQYPMEKVYFNPVGKALADGMDRDYWYEALYGQFQYILENDPAEEVVVSCYKHAGIWWNCYLTPEEKSRVRMVQEDHPDTEYIIDSADTTYTDSFIGFVPVHRRYVDGILISTVYVSQNVIDERFDGRYPKDIGL